MAVMYYYAPDAEQDWVWLTPGSIFATALWVIASLGFKLYITNMGAYTETYGAIGGVMVLMLWFYISGLVVLVGAEMNAEIEHASPYGKEEGEKVPGERQKIGPARMRAWLERQTQQRGKPPSADEVKAAVGPPPPGKQPPGSTKAAAPERAAPPRALPPRAGMAPAGVSTWLIGMAVVTAQVWFAAKSLARRRPT